VTCEFENGVKEVIGEEQLEMLGKLKKIRFTPLAAGSGNTFKIIAGVVLFTIGAFTGQGWLMAIGASLVIGGVVGMLTPQPKINTGDIGKKADGTSYYFDGPVNTEMEGVPVPLIYGKKVLVGSHPISASLTVEEVAI